ncbi:integrin alpha FG-GAP repeat-containing protein 2, partial [Actinomortierella ambigua]
MPSIRHVSLVQKLRWHVTGNISPTAFAIGDVDGNGDNEFVIGNLVGELFVFKGNHPEGLPWLTCKGLGTITAVAIGDIRNWGRNSVVVISAEGLCHIFDISGIEDDPHIQVQHGGDGHGSAVGDMAGSGRQLTVPATPSLRPVPDHHHHNRYHGQHHNHHHHQSHHSQSLAHATPPIPHYAGGLQGSATPRQNSTHSSFHQHTVFMPSSSSTTPIHTPSIGSNSRRGSEAASGPGSAGATGSTMAGSARTTSAMLAGLIGTPLPTTTTSSTPLTSTASSSVTVTAGAHPPSLTAGPHLGGQHSPQIAHQHTGRSINSNSSTTPLLRPQLVVMPASSPALNGQSGNLSPSTSTRAATIATMPHSSSLQSQHQQLPPHPYSSAQQAGSSQHQQPQPLSQQAQQRGSISFANASRASSPGVVVGSETPRWRFVNGRRVLEKPNLTLPVPVNINRAQIADIDGDGINELVLARTDRILHSYALHVGRTPSPPLANQNGGVGHSRKSTMASVSTTRQNTSGTTGAAGAETTAGGHHPTPSLTGSHSEGTHALNFMRLLSRTSSISTLDSNGLLSPVEERRETTIHYPSITSAGRAYATMTGVSPGASVGSEQQQQSSSSMNKSSQQQQPPVVASRLILVEKKRWALDGQIHCLSVSTDSETGMPLLLIAQPGLNFVMIDHKGTIIRPPNQVVRDTKSLSNLGAPDTPTKSLGSGDVATDIVCATYYEGHNGSGKPKNVIGLMSMDGVLALHDMKQQTARVHDLDSTHKIFGFSKLNFGRRQQQPHENHQHHHHSRRHQHPRTKGGDKADRDPFDLSDSSDSDDDDDVHGGYGRSAERLSSLKYSPRHRREYERLKKRAKQQQQQGGALIDQILEDDEGPIGSFCNNDNEGEDDDDDDDFLDLGEHEKPSLLVKHPAQPALQNDIFVGCSWSGITFFIDQDFNTAQYDFESRVCAFGA